MLKNCDIGNIGYMVGFPMKCVISGKIKSPKLPIFLFLNFAAAPICYRGESDSYRFFILITKAIEKGFYCLKEIIHRSSFAFMSQSL